MFLLFVFLFFTPILYRPLARLSIGFAKVFLIFFDLFFDDVCDYVVFELFRPLVGYGDEDGRAGLSLNAYIVKAIDRQMSEDGFSQGGE